MLADPQSMTIAGTATSFPKTGLLANGNDYTDPTGKYRLRVQQQSTSNIRRTTISLQNNKIAADPLTAVNTRKSALSSVSSVAPLDGFTITELKDDLVALATYITANSAAIALRILAGEK